jgi:hypothetical protein
MSQLKSKFETLSKHSGHYQDLIEGSLLNDNCITPKEAVAAMQEYGEQIALEIKSLQNPPSVSQDEQEEKLLDEIITKIFWARRTEFIKELNKGHDTWKEFNDNIRFYISRFINKK